MSEDWTKEEVALIVQDYFRMLAVELQEQHYNKTAYRKGLLPLLNGRSEGSIEFKHQNISAVLANMGLPFIKGYKPRANYQQLLEDEVGLYLQGHRLDLEPRFERFADAATIFPKLKVDFNTILGEEPEPMKMEEKEPTYRPIKTNYLEKEQNNRRLGAGGEELVIAFEQYRLQKAGKPNLAEQIEWIAKEKGDGAGFDILSKNTNGTDRFIEVKTTKLTKETPIYLTRTEISFALLRAKDFYLYRVYNFDMKPQLFIKNGPYEGFCRLRPESFKGYF
jgi:hypothetical protein